MHKNDLIARSAISFSQTLDLGHGIEKAHWDVRMSLG